MELTATKRALIDERTLDRYLLIKVAGQIV